MTDAKNEKMNLGRLAIDIAGFIRKWGLWRGVQILTGGMCYSFNEDGKLDVTQDDIISPNSGPDSNELCNLDFASREEYEDFIGKLYVIKESKVREFLEDETGDDICYSDTFFDDGYIANYIINEFRKIFERYGLWYELGFSWTLTAYKNE